MVIVAIDPGPTESALVTLSDDGMPSDAVIADNLEIIRRLYEFDVCETVLAIEMIASYGMPVGADIFETCVTVGSLSEAWGGPCERVYRREVKLHLCGTARAKDANIRQALIDRYGPGKDKAIGKKANPGPLHGFRSHMWAALAVGVTYLDRLENSENGSIAPAVA